MSSPAAAPAPPAPAPLAPLEAGDLAAPEAPQSAPSPRRVRTRQRLMAAAVDVFAERGVIGASVEEICEAAGFTRGAFYSNFADKDALVLALLEQGIAAEYAATERAIADLKAEGPGVPLPEAVSRVLDRVSGGGRTDRTSALAQQELLLYAARSPALREPYRQFDRACRTQIEVLVADALDFAGLEFTLPTDLALDLLVAAHDHMHQVALFTDEVDPTAMHALILGLTRPRPGASVRPADRAI